MPDIITTIYFATIGASIHPLLYIVFDKKYQCRPANAKSLYLVSSKFSGFATHPVSIIICITLAILGVFANNFCLLLPLLIITWRLYIGDRFLSLARGQGAPGYFCFLNTLIVFIAMMPDSYSTFSILGFLIQFIKVIIVVEYGSIFLSAGLFKFADLSKGNGMGFALGMLNPMWSKIYNWKSLINKNTSLINYLGPALQIIGGVLFLTGNPVLGRIGTLVISMMFLSITPQTRLSWLCPAISLGMITSYLSLIELSQHVWFPYLFPVLLMLRLIVMANLFREYFTKIEGYWLISSLSSIYRRSLGVIIWKVFTFDIVRYICAKNVIVKDFSNIYQASSNTSVYDSIVLSSLLSSEKYLPANLYMARVNVVLQAFELDVLNYIVISKAKTNEEDLDCNKFIDNINTYSVKSLDLKSLGKISSSINQTAVFDFFSSYSS